MIPSDDRRLADEHFRRELAERLKALEKSTEFLAHSINKLDDAFSKYKMEQLELHYTLFGGPKEDNVGLLEKFRKMATRDKWIIWAVAVGLGFLGKLVSPLYDKAVSAWAYNSISEKWMREQERPKITHRHIVIKREPVSDSDSSD